MVEDPGIQRGREERARQRAEQRAKMDAAREAERRRSRNDPEKEHYFAAACTPVGVMGSGERLFLFLLFATIGTVVVTGGLDSLFHWSARLPAGQDALQYYGARLWPLFPCYVVVGFALLIIGRLAARRARERELSWIESLPFPVGGYLDAFGNGTWHRELKVTLSFTGDPMPKADLARLVDVFSPGASIKDWSDELEFKVMHAGRLGPFARLFETSGGRNAMPGHEYTSNRALLLLFHDVVAEVLLPLHRSHPINSVKLDA